VVRDYHFYYRNINLICGGKMNNSINKDASNGIKVSIVNNIPIIEIDDPYAYVHKNTILAQINIIRTNGKHIRQLIRTKHDGYCTMTP
jgi:hypothetical protein